MKTINLTQHLATADQTAVGVVDLPEAARAECARLLTFDECPAGPVLRERADQLAALAREHGDSVGADRVMIGGAPFFMAPLESALRSRGLTPVYAFSRRESVDSPQPDGSVRKTTVFRHAGVVEACDRI